jgi:diguanylate cyclase
MRPRAKLSPRGRLGVAAIGLLLGILALAHDAACAAIPATAHWDGSQRGLADSMNRLKAQKLAAERAAGAAQRELAAGLERQVEERTLALATANQRLNELSITDELTGVYNRRHFNACSRDALQRHSRSGRPLALCMIDIDHFKAYNDRYGHLAGDRALRDVAQALRGRLRRADDRLFRLGGEEFGVLLAVDDLDAAGAFAECLRLAVSELARPHAGCPAGVLTASFGLACLGAEAVRRATPESMYAAADQLLYRAEAAGRNRTIAASVDGAAQLPARAMILSTSSPTLAAASPCTSSDGQ